MRGWLAIAAMCVAPAASADEPTPDARARAVVGAQLAAIGDPHALLATLPADAVILGNGSFVLARGERAPAVLATLGAAPSGLPPLAADIQTLDAAATADALWLVADVAIVHAVRPGYRTVTRDTTTARLVELLARDDAGAWRVVALAFSSGSGRRAAGDQLGVPRAGPLAEQIATRGRLDPELAERTTRLRAAIEVHGRGWGFCAGDVEVAGDPHRTGDPALLLHAMLFAVEDRDGWRVVAVHATR